MNVIAKLFKVSTPAVLTWIKNFAIANYEKPVPKDAILIEIDEMWHFLKSKKKSLDLESILPGNWKNCRLAMWWS